MKSYLIFTTSGDDWELSAGIALVHAVDSDEAEKLAGEKMRGVITTIKYTGDMVKGTVSALVYYQDPVVE